MRPVRLNPDLIRYGLWLGAAIVLIAMLAACAGTADDRGASSGAAGAAAGAAAATGPVTGALGSGVATPSPVPPRRSDLAHAVYFDYDSSVLRSDAIPVIDAWAAYLRKRGLAESVQLEGHTDERGTPAYNNALGERRAIEVRRALVARGVARDRFEVVSYGEQSPQAYGRDEFAWSRNRRVELELD